MARLTAVRVGLEVAEREYSRLENKMEARILEVLGLPGGTRFPVYKKEGLKVPKALRDHGFGGGVIVFNASMRDKCQEAGFEVVFHPMP